MTQEERTELRTPEGQTVLVPDTGVPTTISPGAVSPDGARVAGPSGRHEVWVVDLDRDGVAGEPTAWSVEGLPGYGPDVLGWLDDDSLLLGSHDNDTSNLRQHLYDLDVTTGAVEEISLADPGWTGAAITRLSVAGDLIDGASVAEVSVLDRGRVPRMLGLVSWSVLAVLGVDLLRRVRVRRRAVTG